MPYQRPRTPIGRRREKISLQREVAADDGAGGQSVTWQTYAQPWGEVTPLDARDQEALAAMQLTVKHGYHFAIPYRTDTTPKDRLVYRGKTMEIKTVVDD